MTNPHYFQRAKTSEVLDVVSTNYASHQLTKPENKGKKYEGLFWGFRDKHRHDSKQRLLELHQEIELEIHTDKKAEDLVREILKSPQAKLSNLEHLALTNDHCMPIQNPSIKKLIITYQKALGKIKEQNQEIYDQFIPYIKFLNAHII